MVKLDFENRSLGVKDSEISTTFRLAFWPMDNKTSQSLRRSYSSETWFIFFRRFFIFRTCSIRTGNCGYWQIYSGSPEENVDSAIPIKQVRREGAEAR